MMLRRRGGLPPHSVQKQLAWHVYALLPNNVWPTQPRISCYVLIAHAVDIPRCRSFQNSCLDNRKAEKYRVYELTHQRAPLAVVCNTNTANLLRFCKHGWSQ